MFERPLMRLLPDGQRLLLQQGPIDLVILASGEERAVRTAYEAAARRFEGLLAELCGELDLLRSPVTVRSAVPEGVVARRMHKAVSPFAADAFVTPMAAVAGAVAEEILGALVEAAPLTRAFVNNGGDIALHLTEGEHFRIALVNRPDHPNLFGTTVISAADGIRGIATSGYPGRSFSRGIAESVTVLAATAAMADAAATIIANAVDLPGHPGVTRVPANSIQSDSDLRETLVTRHVGQLAEAEITEALAAGLGKAAELYGRGLIRSCAIHLQGRTRTLALPAFIDNSQRNADHA